MCVQALGLRMLNLWLSPSHTPALNYISMWVKRTEKHAKTMSGHGGKCLQPQLLPELRQEDSLKTSF